MFRFKQFSVDQTGCAMKINTDGVLLAALLQSDNPQRIVDIGTGTGVIALMLAQRFPEAEITGVEIDAQAVSTASRNFVQSPFNNRLDVYPGSFQNYFSIGNPAQADLIVSNPPFFIDALKSPDKKRELAKHADIDFFSNLLEASPKMLTKEGSLWMILPIDTSDKVTAIAGNYGLHLIRKISIRSFETSNAHRYLIELSKSVAKLREEKFVIYAEQNQYSVQYLLALKEFFLNF